MHNDFFAWVRLALFIILILAFTFWATLTDAQYQMEPPEPKEAEGEQPLYIAPASFYTIIPTEAEEAPELTLTEPLEEITPPTEVATIATEPPTEPIPTKVWKSLGTYELTAYCSCEKCCGQWAKNRPTDQNGKPIVYTSTGAIAKAGTTIAVDPRVIPYGSEIQIDGHTYIAQDCGGAIKGNRIDVYFDNHQDALVFGRQKSEIFIKTTVA